MVPTIEWSWERSCNASMWRPLWALVSLLTSTRPRLLNMKQQLKQPTVKVGSCCCCCIKCSLKGTRKEQCLLCSLLTSIFTTFRTYCTKDRPHFYQEEVPVSAEFYSSSNLWLLTMTLASYLDQSIYIFGRLWVPGESSDLVVYSVKANSIYCLPNTGTCYTTRSQLGRGRVKLVTNLLGRRAIFREPTHFLVWWLAIFREPKFSI